MKKGTSMRIRYISSLILIATGLVGASGWAGADHAGEAAVVSKTTDLVDGDTVTVQFSNFVAGGQPVRVVIAGQGTFTTQPDKLNYDDYGSAQQFNVNADGTGSATVQVVADHGLAYDSTPLNCMNVPCWLVVIQPPLATPHFVATPISFRGGVAHPDQVKPTDAPTTTAPPTSTTVPAPTSSAVVATSTKSTSTSTTTAAPSTTTSTTIQTVTVSEPESGGSAGLWIGIGVVAVVAIAGAFVAVKKKSDPLAD